MSIETEASFAESLSVRTWPFMKELYVFYDDSDSLQVTNIIRRIILANAGVSESNVSYDPVSVKDTLDAVSHVITVINCHALSSILLLLLL